MYVKTSNGGKGKLCPINEREVLGYKTLEWELLWEMERILCCRVLY